LPTPAGINGRRFPEGVANLGRGQCAGSLIDFRILDQVKAHSQTNYMRVSGRSFQALLTWRMRNTGNYQARPTNREIPRITTTRQP